MLRYTKTLSLVLLFSLPAIAMEEKKEQALVAAQETAANPLDRTLALDASFDIHQAQLAQHAQARKALDEQEAKTREERNKAIEGLVAKQKDKEQAISGAKTAAAAVAAQLLALQQEREQKPKEIMDKAHLDVAAYNADADKKALVLKAQQEKATAEQKTQEEALAKIKAKLEKIEKPETAKPTSGFWSLFGY